jgi:hypothetical protein
MVRSLLFSSLKRGGFAGAPIGGVALARNIEWKPLKINSTKIYRNIKIPKISIRLNP